MDGTTEVGALRFQNWPVLGIQSLAFRFEPEDSRTGIYILSFSNGERYVGQSLNVVNRFGSHRRRWGDITHLAFRPFLPEELNLREREVLNSVEQRGFRVRNLDLAGRPGGDSLLNIVMEEQAQAEWLGSDASEPFDAPRYVDAARRVSGLARFQELSSRNDFPELLACAAAYVHSVLPWPSQTEGRFWVATAMASTGRSSSWRRLITISAQNTEVLVIGEVDTKGATHIEGFMNLHESASRGVHRWLRQQDLDTYVQASSYGTVGNVYRVQFTGLRRLSQLLHEGSPIVRPAKELALNLMRKSPSMYIRFHNEHLADAIFNQIAKPHKASPGR